MTVSKKKKKRHPRDPPIQETQIPRYRGLQIQREILNFYRETEFLDLVNCASAAISVESVIRITPKQFCVDSCDTMGWLRSVG